MALWVWWNGVTSKMSKLKLENIVRFLKHLRMIRDINYYFSVVTSNPFVFSLAYIEIYFNSLPELRPLQFVKKELHAYEKVFVTHDYTEECVYGRVDALDIGPAA